MNSVTRASTGQELLKNLPVILPCLNEHLEISHHSSLQEEHLAKFFQVTDLESTQPEEFAKIGTDSEQGSQKFLDRVQGEIAKRGTVDVLRKGLQAYPAKFDFYQIPSEENGAAKERFDKNIFSVTRQLQFSVDKTCLALDMCLFINGLLVMTFELKNSFTKQSVDDAVKQYQNDRAPQNCFFSSSAAYGGAFSRPCGGQQGQDRRQSPRNGGDKQHRRGAGILHGHQRAFAGPPKPLQGHCGREYRGNPKATEDAPWVSEAQ